MQTEDAARKDWLGLLAKAPPGRTAALLTAFGAAPPVTWLRKPEIGTAMVRARMGATGAPFNLGEMTVTRCTLRLSCGAVGHGYVQGRSARDAEAAATVDALMQTGAADEIASRVLGPLREERAAAKAHRAARAAATKVDFFTMVRGED